jgi:TolB-like protein
MTSSGSSSSRRPHRAPGAGFAAAVLTTALLALVGCRSAADVAPGQPGADATGPVIAVLPVENLAGKPAPLDAVRVRLVESLERHGFRVLPDAQVEAVITRHRVRYTAGVEQTFAKALAVEAGAAAILIPSLEVYDEPWPGRVGLFARLVSAGDTPTLMAVDAAGIAGDDTPGLLGLGLIDNPGALVDRAVDTVARSLAQRVIADVHPAGRPAPAKFAPRIAYRADALDPEGTYSVAVVPFFNRSERKYAGDVVALHLIRNLMRYPNLRVVEPGVVREELLRFRIIMTDGISLPDTETVLNAVNADLVLNGEVLEYRDPLSADGAPVVDFAALFIERKTRRIVYSSYSQNTGMDRVFFFDWGRVNTAHAMTASMARALVDRMLLGQPTSPPTGKESGRR